MTIAHSTAVAPIVSTTMNRVSDAFSVSLEKCPDESGSPSVVLTEACSFGVTSLQMSVGEARRVVAALQRAIAEAESASLDEVDAAGVPRLVAVQ